MSSKRIVIHLPDGSGSFEAYAPTPAADMGSMENHLPQGERAFNEEVDRHAMRESDYREAQLEY